METLSVHWQGELKCGCFVKIHQKQVMCDVHTSLLQAKSFLRRGSGNITHWLGALTALSEDPGFVPSPYKVTPNRLQAPGPGDVTSSSVLHRHRMHVVHRHAFRWKYHAHVIKINEPLQKVPRKETFRSLCLYSNLETGPCTQFEDCTEICHCLEQGEFPSSI